MGSEERQKRINIIEQENKAIKDLNDLSEMKRRIQNEKPLHEQVDISEELINKPMKKIANPESENSI